MRRKIVLYNTRAVFWTMPLALLAVGSAVDRRRFDVVVVDGRLDDHFRFYQRLGFGRRRRGLLGVAQRLARWRVERHAYAVPVERWLAALATRSPPLS